MQSSDIPLKLPIPFGDSAGTSYKRTIPTLSQIGITDGAASLTDGFPPLTAQPLASGGKPPDIRDFNGILYEISGWARWVAAGGPVFYDGSFATAIGGYPLGAVVASATTPGTFWACTTENNTSNPDTGGGGWQNVTAVAASNGEVLAGTNSTKFVTPAGLASKAVSGADLLANDLSAKLVTSLALSNLRASVGDLISAANMVKYVTPYALGLLRASAGDVAARTNNALYVTPASLTGLITADDNGIKFPGGYELKMGIDRTFRTGEGAVLVNFPVPFANTCMVVMAVEYVSNPSDTGRDMWAHVSTRAADHFYYNRGAASSGNVSEGFDWFAFGK